MNVTARAGVTWRYLSRRKVKHALRVSQTYVGHDSYALCGTSPGWFVPAADQWRGTGSQAEYDEADRLPECRRCARLVAPAA